MAALLEWILPVAGVAQLWNLIGWAAYPSEVSGGPDDVAVTEPA